MVHSGACMVNGDRSVDRQKLSRIPRVLVRSTDPG